MAKPASGANARLGRLHGSPSARRKTYRLRELPATVCPTLAIPPAPSPDYVTQRSALLYLWLA